MEDQQRIGFYLDKQDIYELACRYMRGLDRLDQSLLEGVFWPDGWCEYGFFNGPAQTFAEFAMGALASHETNHHMIGNVLIEFDASNPDEAFGEVYFNAFHKLENDGSSEDLIIAGRYLDRYERRDGEWRIAYRSERNDWSQTRPTNDPYFDAAPTSLRGGRRDDAVYDREGRRANGAKEA